MLTAGHCTSGVDGLLAAVNLFDGAPATRAVMHDQLDERTRHALHLVDIKGMIPHPEYTKNGIRNDIGVVELAQEVVDVKDMPKLYAGTNLKAPKVLALGYGHSRDLGPDGEPLADTRDYKLREVEIDTFPSSDCNVYKNFDCQEESCICAGQKHKGILGVSFAVTSGLETI